MTKKTRARRATKNVAVPKAAPALSQADIAAAQQVETKAYDFRGTVTLMDQTSQRGFKRIASIARLARVGTPTIDGQFGPVSLFDIESALDTIIAISNESREDINVLAEGVDCDYSGAPSWTVA